MKNLRVSLLRELFLCSWATDSVGSIGKSRLGSSYFSFYTYFQNDPRCSLIIWYQNWNHVLSNSLCFLSSCVFPPLFVSFCLTLYYLYYYFIFLYFISFAEVQEAKGSEI